MTSSRQFGERQSITPADSANRFREQWFTKGGFGLRFGFVAGILVGLAAGMKANEKQRSQVASALRALRRNPLVRAPLDAAGEKAGQMVRLAGSRLTEKAVHQVKHGVFGMEDPRLIEVPAIEQEPTEEQSADQARPAGRPNLNQSKFPTQPEPGSRTSQYLDQSGQSEPST